MFYGSTAEIEAIAPGITRKLKRVDMTVPELEEIVPVVKHVRAVRHVSANKSGEICIPIVNGVLHMIKTTFEEILGKSPKTTK